MARYTPSGQPPRVRQRAGHWRRWGRRAAGVACIGGVVLFVMWLKAIRHGWPATIIAFAAVGAVCCVLALGITLLLSDED